MLIHLKPTCVSAHFQPTLIDFTFYGLVLRGGQELATRRPYPNKTLAVACAKQERGAKDGIFIETAIRLQNFKTVSRWAIGAHIVRHEIAYTVLDTEHDGVSDDVALWMAPHGWPNRWPETVPFRPPVLLAPWLKIPDDIDGPKEIRQEFSLPTLERDRILTLAGLGLPENRRPNLESAFQLA
ncbi:DUF6012 family protein [Neorhizobium sp. T786]|uniref:DUF6012 family protein n=1 Tax=Pseudorhizobium xiangyangii TaxID=2883104 RepID=UPI001CFFE809|nr:DUF6012 family protein [Neorhizobium xiangyangii]MCB5205514.1 DUF6012 family protein [Neorhizobium xiangyangii]